MSEHDEAVSPTITRITGSRCCWALLDKHGDPYPHDIRATRRVVGAGEFYDGDYCKQHADMAVDWARHAIDIGP